MSRYIFFLITVSILQILKKKQIKTTNLWYLSTLKVVSEYVIVV